jgi:hypothetical protein
MSELLSYLSTDYTDFHRFLRFGSEPSLHNLRLGQKSGFRSPNLWNLRNLRMNLTE